MANIIVVGGGPVNRRKTVEDLDRLAEKAKNGLHFIVPLATIEDSSIPPGVNLLVNWVLNNSKTKITFVTPQDDIPAEGTVDDVILAEKGEIVVSDDPDTAALAYDKCTVLAVWDDEDEDLVEFAKRASARGFQVRSLGEGLERIEVKGEVAKPAEAPAPAEDVKTPPKDVETSRKDDKPSVEELVNALAEHVADVALGIVLAKVGK